MKNRILGIFTITSILLLASACSNTFDKAPVENDMEQTSEKAKLILKINKSDSRTILAPNLTLEEMFYTLQGKKDGTDETTIKREHLSYSELTGGSEIIVDVGKWDFTLLAGRFGSPYYKAVIENVDVVTGENSLSFNLEDFPQSNGKGNIRISLASDDTIFGTVKAGLFDLEANIISEYEVLSPNHAYWNLVDYIKNDVPSGIYIVSFKFFKEDGTEIKPGYSELVQVKVGRTSEAKRTLENLERLHSITYSLNGGELSNDSLPSSFYEYQRITLPTSDDVLRNGYTFGGWYENSDFSGDAVTEIPSLTKTDKTFYAKWIPITYKITYEGLDGAENPNPEMYTSDGGLKLQSAVSTQDGMAFAGWFKDGKVVASIPKGSYGDIVLTANWKSGKGFSADKLSTLSSWLSSQDGEGPFDVIITGSPSFSTIKTALQNNSSKKVNLDLSGAEITEIAGSAFYNCTSLASVVIPDSVTTIGNGVFSDCTSLTSVTIPDSVTTIGNGVFSDCTSLASVVIPDSVTTIGSSAFYNCTSLASVIIPDSVTTIGGYAFRGCTSLASVTIPDSVTTIGGYAFSGCTSLASIEIGNSVSTIGSDAFSNCENLKAVYVKSIVAWCGISFDSSDSNPLRYAKQLYIDGIEAKDITIPDGITTINDYAFYNYTSLASVTIPNSVTTIGGSAFSGCTSLASVTIPDSVTNIGEDAFYNCTSLAGVRTGNGVTEIGRYTFFNCKNLASVEISNSVESIGKSAFYNCTSLLSVEFPTSLTTIGEDAFSGCQNLKTVYAESIAAWCGISFDSSASNPLCYAKQLYIDGVEAKDIIIPDSITTINDYAFYNCTSLANVEIPNSVTTIRSQAFYNCNNLASVKIGNGVTEIGGSAFNRCTNLAIVEIGNSVETIGTSAFYDCETLASVEIPDSVTSISREIFYNCKNLSSVKIGNKVATIDEKAFSGCTRLAGVEIPDSVKTIDTFAFSNCKKLESLKIGSNVTTIGEKAFSDCTSLASVEIPDSVTTIGSEPFYNCTSLATVKIGNGMTSIGDNMFKSCTSLASVEIPDSVIAIGNYAFSGCTNLASIEIPDSVTTINNYAFSGCTSLTNVGIGRNVATLSIFAFYNCESLASVNIPNNLTNIGQSAFQNCTNLETVTFENTTGWYYTNSSVGTSGTDIDVIDASANAENLRTNTWGDYYLKRKK